MVAERVLVVRRLDDRLTVVGDETPAGIRREYLMAFDQPRLLEAQGGVVVYESRWRARAQELAADLPQARARLAFSVCTHAAAWSSSASPRRRR